MANKPEMDKPALDNHANQLNENNDAYWKSRGQPRPATEQPATPASTTGPDADGSQPKSGARKP